MGLEHRQYQRPLIDLRAACALDISSTRSGPPLMAGRAGRALIFAFIASVICRASAEI